MAPLRRLAPGLAGLLAALAAGCGDPNGRHPVSGSVTLKGQPMDQGNIVFMPVAATGTQTGVPVRGGRYEVPKDRGLVPGSYRVMVFSEVFSDGAAAPGGRKDPVSSGERVSPKYNMQTKLTAEVVSGGPNVFDFAVD